ncbi:hypothetical protein [Amycolatopsis sp. NBRC 101858]|uniref:hypothetical protein n=1 Tax=Amycolatopsis sp. NBRC 101858 TaxID=3032200 RepID=UPI002552FBF5|nr:hypothetical protein [Amycolatopsis sp. NBRC 101858]
MIIITLPPSFVDFPANLLQRSPDLDACAAEEAQNRIAALLKLKDVPFELATA